MEPTTRRTLLKAAAIGGATGRYLVVCGVLPHFLEGMHGYVNVKA